MFVCFVFVCFILARLIFARLIFSGLQFTCLSAVASDAIIGSMRTIYKKNFYTAKRFRILFSLLAALLLLISACIFFSFGKVQVFAGPDSRPDSGQSTVTDRPVRILCYGDSNTYGYDPDPYADRYPENVRWTGILQEQLGENFQIIEEGKNGRATGYQPGQGTIVPEELPGSGQKTNTPEELSGSGQKTNTPEELSGSFQENSFRDNTADVVFIPASQEGPQDLRARLEMNRPVDILVIMLGSNDCRPSYGLTAEEVASGMDALVNTAENWAGHYTASTMSIVIVAPPVIDDEILSTSGGSQELLEYTQKARALGDLYRQVAESHNCVFVDARDGIEISILDHLHLTERGHAQLAQLMADVLHPLIQ